MLLNVNANNTNTLYRQIFSTASEDEDTIPLTIDTEQVEGALSICRQSSAQFDSIRRLCLEELLPYLEITGKPFAKASRSMYKFLENSVWVDKVGNIFEQYHLKDKYGATNTDIKNKGYLGEGGYKKVWDLKPLQTYSDCPEMVRTRFHPEFSSATLLARLEAIQQFKNEVNSEYLLIPDTVICTNSKGKKVIYQMMPKAPELDLFKVLEKKGLSDLGKLRAIRNLGLGLMDMHKVEWAHLDVATENILVMNQDRVNPITKLGDFDLSRKFIKGNQTPYFLQPSVFTDPKCVRGKAASWEDAKIHDQFSFGITACELITGKWIRSGFKEEELKAWVTEDDLKAVSGFLELNTDIQNIIRECCVGEIRPYKLPEFVASINRLIDNILNTKAQ